MFSKRSLIVATAAALIAVPVFAQESTPPSAPPTPVPSAPPAMPLNPVVPPMAPAGPNSSTIRSTAKRVALEKAAFLGVTVSPVPAALGEQLKLPRGFGLVVQSVVEKGPAEAAGVKQYDVLQKLDDQMLVLPQQLEILVRSHKIDDAISLTLIRQGQPMTVSAKLSEKEMPPLEISSAGGFFTDGAPDGSTLLTTPSFNDFNQKLSLTDLNQTKHEMVWQNGNFVIRIQNAPGGEKQLVVTTVNGDVLYDGPMNGNEEIQKLPPDLQAIIKNGVALMDAKWKAETLSPADAALASAKKEAAIQAQSLKQQLELMKVSADAVRASSTDATANGSQKTGREFSATDSGFFVVTFENGKAVRLLAEDWQGTVSFNGSVLTDEDRAKMPAEIRGQFEKIIQHPEMTKGLTGN